MTQENREAQLADGEESMEAMPMGTERRDGARTGAWNARRIEVIKRSGPQEVQDLAAQHIFQRLSQKILDDDEFGHEPTHEDRLSLIHI